MAISKAVEIQRLKEKIISLDDSDLEIIVVYANAIQAVRKDMAAKPQTAASKAATKEGSAT